MRVSRKWILAMVMWCVAGGSWGGEWQENFNKALSEAKAGNKYMLVNFSGSDWCGWCIRLDREVFSQPAFQAYAAEKLVLVQLDFPRRKEQSEELKRQNSHLMTIFGVEGFPAVLLLSPTGDLVARTGYQPGGPEAYIEHLQSFMDQNQSDGKTK